MAEYLARKCGTGRYDSQAKMRDVGWLVEAPRKIEEFQRGREWQEQHRIDDEGADEWPRAPPRGRFC
jgi:hypothetical protein